MICPRAPSPTAPLQRERHPRQRTVIRKIQIVRLAEDSTQIVQMSNGELFFDHLMVVIDELVGPRCRRVNPRNDHGYEDWQKKTAGRPDRHEEIIWDVICHWSLVICHLLRSANDQ